MHALYARGFSGFDVNRGSDDAEVARGVDDCAAVLLFISPAFLSSRACYEELLYIVKGGKPILLLLLRLRGNSLPRSVQP